METAISLMTVAELKKKAKSMKLRGYSKLKKQELIDFIYKNKKKTPTKTSPQTILNKDVLGIIMDYAEDKLNDDRRKQIKYAKKNLEKHLKKKDDFTLLKLRSKGLMYYQIIDNINKYNRKTRELVALSKTREQLQKASVKELREWIKVLKVGQVGRLKKPVLLKMVNKTLDELYM
jgi:2-iminoacetate synthase ThiH